MKYPAYSEYKDSGVEWLGDVPEQWSLKKIKYLFQIRKRISGEIGHDVLSITQQGIKIKDIESGEGQLSMDYSKYQFVEVDDFAMNHMDLLTGFVDISKFHGVTSPDYRVFSLVDNHSTPQYYLYLLQMGYWGKIFYSHGQGSSQLGRWRFPTEKFKSFAFPFPSQEEQAIIANFLDRETTKIDTLITKQQKLISLLQEKRQAVISHAVTKGINPDAKMKDSGVEWLGDVPEHWLKSRLKHVVNQIIDTEHKTVHFVDNGKYLVARTANIRNGKLITKGAKHTDSDGYNGWTKRGVPKHGDIILTREAPAGEACIVPETPVVCLGQRTVLIKKVQKIDSKYIVYSIYAGLSQEFIEQLSQGATVVHFNMPDIGNIPLFEIPSQEQSDIVKFLDSTISKIDNLILKTNNATALMKERRTALISAAVTGKIDVGNA